MSTLPLIEDRSGCCDGLTAQSLAAFGTGVEDSFETLSHGGQQALTEEQAFQLEAKRVEERKTYLQATHGISMSEGIPISLAFSGGGQRAASFAAGVLWNIAARDLFPHVRHISAVSGGGYVASAIMSHFLADMAPEGLKARALHQWYRERVADCLLQLQDNISHLVRSRRKPLFLIDLPFFFVTSLCAMLFSVVTLSFYIVIPLAIFIEYDFGPLMRATYCYPPKSICPTCQYDPLFGRFPPSLYRHVLNVWFPVFATCLLVSTAARVAKRVGCWKRPKETSFGNNALPYFWCRAVRQVSTRALVVIIFYLVVVALVFMNQIVTWGSATDVSSPTGAWARQTCQKYVLESAYGPVRCSDRYLWGTKTVPWYNDDGRYGDAFKQVYVNLNVTMIDRTDSAAPFVNYHLFFIFNLILLVVSAASIVVRSRLVSDVASIVGPMWAAWFVANLCAWKVFGPVTGQYFSAGVRIMPYNEHICWHFFVGSLSLVVVTLPFYGQLQRIIHRFNTVSLRDAYYKMPKRRWLLKEIASNPFSPNLILGACVQDYGRPCDKDDAPFADFGLTPLFLGGRRTGCWPTSATRLELVVAVGVSSGAVDMAMSIAYSLKTRWWMGLLSLQMGAWVRIRKFQTYSRPNLGDCVALRTCVQRFCECLGCLRYSKPGGREEDSWRREVLEEVVVRLPGTLFYWIWYTMIGRMSSEVEQDGNCLSDWLRTTAFWLFILFVLSFHLSFIPAFSGVLRSPFVRHVSMIMKHHHISWFVPENVYLLDGGLIDAIGAYDLLRRRERLILALDASSPPSDPCKFIRQCLETCCNDRICSFRDPKQPGRDVRYVMQEFAEDASRAFLHLEVLYEPWGEGIANGDIFFVPMRIPDGDVTPEGGRLSREELLSPWTGDIAAGVIATGAAQQLRMAAPEGAEKRPPRAALRGVCCFDGCHDTVPGCLQNACGKFPNIVMTNQFLTPRLFSELCRLGQELTAQTLDAMAIVAAARAGVAV